MTIKVYTDSNDSEGETWQYVYDAEQNRDLHSAFELYIHRFNFGRLLVDSPELRDAKPFETALFRAAHEHYWANQQTGIRQVNSAVRPAVGQCGYFDPVTFVCTTLKPPSLTKLGSMSDEELIDQFYKQAWLYWPEDPKSPERAS